MVEVPIFNFGLQSIFSNYFFNSASILSSLCQHEFESSSHQYFNQRAPSWPRSQKLKLSCMRARRSRCASWILAVAYFRVTFVTVLQFSDIVLHETFNSMLLCYICGHGAIFTDKRHLIRCFYAIVVHCSRHSGKRQH